MHTNDTLLNVLNANNARPVLDNADTFADFLKTWPSAHIYHDYAGLEDAFWTVKLHGPSGGKLFAARNTIPELLGDVIVKPEGKGNTRLQRDEDHPIYITDRYNAFTPKPAGTFVSSVFHHAYCSGTPELFAVWQRCIDEPRTLTSIDIIRQGDPKSPTNEYLMVARHSGGIASLWLTRETKEN